MVGIYQVEYPQDVSYTQDDRFKRYKYTAYNFTMATYWTPYLVKSSESDTKHPADTGYYKLYVDEFDEAWTTQIEEFDYVIISAGHWFFRPLAVYEKGQLVGCHYCLIDNMKDLDLVMYHGYRKAFRTAFKAINSLKNYKGVTYLRTFAPSHFDGVWDHGANCVRTRPFRSNETHLEGQQLEFYLSQVQEFREAEREGRKKGLKYRLLDTTKAMLMRPDGHPSRYGHWPQQNVSLYNNDCVHWCLPGPIDTLNDFFLEMLKNEPFISAEEKKIKMKYSNIDRKLLVR